MLSHLYLSVFILISRISIPSEQFGGGGDVEPNCESPEGSPRCVCDTEASMERLNVLGNPGKKILRREPAAVRDRVQNFQCIAFKALPPFLKIDWNDNDAPSNRNTMHRLRLKRSHELPFKVRHKRSLTLGYPSNEELARIIPLMEERSHHQYVGLGGRADLKCRSDSDLVEIVDDTDFRKVYEWTHSDGRFVDSSEILILPNGDLMFHQVQLFDSDVYQCHVTYAPLNEAAGTAPKPEMFLQQLDVVTEPILWLTFSEVYTAQSPTCSQDAIAIISLNLGEWIREYVCYYCPIRHVHVGCLSTSDEAKESLSEHRIVVRFTLSALDVESRMTSFSGGYSIECNIACMEALHLKLMQIVRNNLEKLMLLNIQLESPKRTTVYSAVPGSMMLNLDVGCPAGYFSQHKLCFPCPPGDYSPIGEIECIKCPKDTYQPSTAKGECLDCPKGYKTLGNVGAIAEYDCKTESIVGVTSWFMEYWDILLIIAALILVPLISLICCIPYCCPKSWLGQCCAPCSCCGPDPDFLIEEKKELLPRGGGSKSLRSRIQKKDEEEEEDEEEEDEGDDTEMTNKSRVKIKRTSARSQRSKIVELPNKFRKASLKSVISKNAPATRLPLAQQFAILGNTSSKTRRQVSDTRQDELSIHTSEFRKNALLRAQARKTQYCPKKQCRSHSSETQHSRDFYERMNVKEITEMLEKRMGSQPNQTSGIFDQNRNVSQSDDENNSIGRGSSSSSHHPIDVRKLAEQLNRRDVRHFTMIPERNISSTQLIQEDSSKSSSSGRITHSPINDINIPRRPEKQGFRSEMKNFTRGKVPPGAFTYMPAQPKTSH